jgi:protein TonB
MPPVVTPNWFFQPAKPVPRQPVIETAEPTPHPLPPQTPQTSNGKQNPVAPIPGPTLPARGIAGTHTIPHYPMLALRLGHAGNVRLKLTVDEQGRVVAAELLNSSGHDELDDAAIAWVKAHWRYTPALQNGTAVESSMSVVVTFRLDQAR